MIGAITRSRVLAWAICMAGIAFSAFVAFIKADLGLSLFPSVCIVGPWLVLGALCFWWRSSRGLIAAGVLLLACEIYIYYDVFIAPRGSHGDVLAYFAKPFLQVLVLLAVGLVGERWIALDLKSR